MRVRLFYIWSRSPNEPSTVLTATHSKQYLHKSHRPAHPEPLFRTRSFVWISRSTLYYYCNQRDTQSIRSSDIIIIFFFGKRLPHWVIKWKWWESEFYSHHSSNNKFSLLNNKMNYFDKKLSQWFEFLFILNVVFCIYISACDIPTQLLFVFFRSSQRT